VEARFGGIFLGRKVVEMALIANVKGSLNSLRFDQNSSMNYNNWNVQIQLQAPWGIGIARETRQAAAF
jgi:hypothetical protein